MTKAKHPPAPPMTLGNMRALGVSRRAKSERDEKKDTYDLIERSYGAFERSFQLPDTTDEDQIKADFDKGVLRIVVPKHPAAVKAEKKIPIGKG